MMSPRRGVAQPKTPVVPLLPMTNGVVLPGMVVSVKLETSTARSAIAAARAADSTLLLVPTVDGQPTAIGTLATVEETARLRSGADVLVVRGLHRARLGTKVADTEDVVWVQVEPIDDPAPASERAQQLAREYRATVENIVEARSVPQVAEMLRAITDPGALADLAGYSPDLSFEQKVQILQTLDVEQRLELVTEWAKRTLADLELREKIGRDVAEDSSSPIKEFRAKIASAGMPDAARQEAERELGRLERTSPQSPEYGWIRTYLDWITEIPWSKRTDDNLNITDARRILHEDHTGLKDVKERIVEYLSVRRLRKERGLTEADTTAKRGSGAILTLIGPPGVGKTSLGESVARALGRKF